MFLHKYLVCVMWVWIVTVNAKQVLEDITVRERQLLNHWCPSVDICDQNATTADLKLNGKLDNDRISCCLGCSCHPGCKEHMNCCYPNKNAGNDVVSNSTSKYKCLHSRLFKRTDGHIGEFIKDRAPSYVTVTRPPVDGCVYTTPISVNDDLLLYPTCDDVPVTPWGSYFPVYSKSVDKIYNNVLCARCHGVMDTEYFTPWLVCNKFGIKLKKPFTPLTKFVQTITSGKISNPCYVDFRYENTYDVSNKLCYNDDVIDTCQSSDKSQEDFDKINMTADELRNLCEAGINAPTRKGNAVYKNVFCYLCRELFVATCKSDEDIRQTKETFIYLLSPDMLLDHENILEKQPPLETKCLPSKLESTDSTCRELHCPSGLIRNSSGDCIMVGQEWIPAGHFMFFKLTPTNDKFLKTLSEAGMLELGQNLKQSSPWSPLWTLIGLYFREDTTECDEQAQFLVILAGDTTKSEQIYEDVKQTVGELWMAEINGTIVEFQQSFLEYDTAATNNNRYPRWQRLKQNYSSSDGKYFGCGPIIWKKIFVISSPIIRKYRPGKVTKLFFCEQIQLEPDEYVLEHDMYYLRSNLTTGVLQRDEFELVQDSDGIIHARVCLMDTAYYDTRSNGASSRLVTSFVSYFALVAVSLFLCL